MPPFPFALGTAVLRKKETLQNLIPTLNKLPENSTTLVNKIRTSLSLVSNATLTPEERMRVPSDYKDIVTLTDLSTAWCWVNCSMRLSTQELNTFKRVVTDFKKSFNVINTMLESSPVPARELKQEFIQFINLRIQLDTLKQTLQAKYPPTGTKEINNPVSSEGKESGTPLWAKPLANIYHNIHGPDNVNTNSFIRYLQEHRSNLTEDEQKTVHSTLSEFGTRRNNTAITLRNYLSKTKAALPNSFKKIFRSNQYTKSHGGKRKTRKHRR